MVVATRHEGTIGEMEHRVKILNISAALILMTPIALKAEEFLSPEEFESYTSGQTAYFTQGGEPYGAEQYFLDRRVIWTFLDGQCLRGAWFENGNEICFAYETSSNATCWNFIQKGDEKVMRVVGDDPEDDLVFTEKDSRALKCPGPGVGVSFKP